jgi:hypothetical protein
MGMLGEMFPSAQFLVTGVIGPQANAHGPNEFLHLAFSESLTCCISAVVAHHFESKVEIFLATEAANVVEPEIASVDESVPSPTTQNDAFCQVCTEPMTSQGGCVSPTCGGVVQKSSSRRLSKRTSASGAPAEAYASAESDDKSGKDCVVM